jgi:hypothetical protein
MLTSSDADQNVVQIFNSAHTHLYGLFQTIPTERRRSTDDAAITFAEQGPENPNALLKWFYPGRLTGHGFVYSSRQEKELEPDTRQTALARQQPTSNYEPAGMGN